MKTRHNLCNLWEDFLLREPLQHFHLSSDVLPCRQWKCDNKWYVNFAVTFSYPIGHKKCDKEKDKHFLYIYLVYFDHTCWVVVHGDCYVTVILYLHTTPAYPSPWYSTCYIMITWTAAQQVWWSYLLSRGPWLLLRNIYIKPQSFPALQNACYVTITMDHPSTSAIDLCCHIFLPCRPQKCDNKDRTCWAAVHCDHYITGTVPGTGVGWGCM